MVSFKTLLCFLYWKLPFTVCTDASDKQLVDFISQNNKPIVFFSIIWIKPQCNYTATDKGLLVIVECLKKFWVS